MAKSTGVSQNIETQKMNVKKVKNSLNRLKTFAFMIKDLSY